MKKVFLLAVLGVSMMVTSCKKDQVAPVAETYSYTSVNIGPWDMDENTFTVVAHNLPDYNKIVSVEVVIYSDNEGQQIQTSLLSSGSYVFEWSPGNMALTRVNGGYFDQTAFDDPIMNRGKVNFIYKN